MNDLSTGSMNATTRTWVERAGRAGLAARGVVLAILAWFMARVALNADSSEWRGSAGGLRGIARQPHGFYVWPFRPAKSHRAMRSNCCSWCAMALRR